MAQAGHTSTPWEVGETYSTHNHPTRYWETTVRSASTATVARACGATKEEAEANARLIAAAPDLREALETVPLRASNGTIEEWAERFLIWHHSVCTPALSKAEGK